MIFLFFLNTNVWGEKRFKLGLLSICAGKYFHNFSWEKENISYFRSSYEGTFMRVFKKKKKLYTHADKPLFDPSDEWSVKFVMSLLSLWFSYFKMNGICIRRQQNNHFLPLAFLLHHQWNWLWIQQFWALWVFLCSSGQAGILFLFSQLPGKYQHF